MYGLACIELSTGEFKVAEPGSLDELQNELERLRPSECLIPVGLDLPWKGFLFRFAGYGS